ncbi:hypothetical protein N1851_012541 [Merluccius polli]|uniref:Uncharacterized protein n=1 Tax=Merluccius polli TaxID=89951 RepID=A0AA47P4X2_MERPO|nr:hypothetical protein N1851_012541 [Merluccius polli]
MRFEEKHKFFKRAIRNTQNFKNVAMTLATKHQKADAADKEAYNETPVGIIIIGEENSPLNPSRLGIILEGNVVFDGLANLPQAFCVLFGLTYALHLDYPKYMKNTFLFVQQVMFNLGKSQLPPKIQTLKNQLEE